MLLGWDRPVNGRVAALQLLNMKETLEKSFLSVSTNIPQSQNKSLPQSQFVSVPLSVSLTESYYQIIPKVLIALGDALVRETSREGKTINLSMLSFYQCYDYFFFHYYYYYCY